MGGAKQMIGLCPRGRTFQGHRIKAFYEAFRHKPQTTFGNVKADVIFDKGAAFEPGPASGVIRIARWAG